MLELMVFLLDRESQLKQLRLVFEQILLNFGIDPVGFFLVNLLVVKIRVLNDRAFAVVFLHKKLFGVIEQHVD